MPRPTGLPKTGGRKSGTPNKKTALLHEALEAQGLDVPGRLAKLLPQLEPEKQADVLLELMSYLYPKRKALQINSHQEVQMQGMSRDEVNQIFADPEAKRFGRALALRIADTSTTEE